MLNKLSSKFKKKKPDVAIHQLIADVNQLSALHNFIALCPATTGYNWMGVNRATKALFPTNTIELSQYYSQTVYSDQELNTFCQAIYNSSIHQVILSGFPPYFETIARILAQKNIKIKVIYHGFFSELAGNSQQQEILEKVIKLSQEGIISTIAFNKKGMAESISALWGIETCKIILPTPVPKNSNRCQTTDVLRIGILGNDQFRKNLHNQIVAASMIQNAELHITSDLALPYLPKTIKIVRHITGMPHDEFLGILGSMNINLHLSYSESWGQLTTESLSMGVPCLTAYHSDVFDYSPELKELLVVEDFDNSWAIKTKIEKVISCQENIAVRCVTYIDSINSMAVQSIEKFINA